jgi:hypothetical protein
MTPPVTQFAAPCPFCLSEETEFLQPEAGRWFVACNGCGATGPLGSSPMRAHSPWAALAAARKGRSDLDD